ncbi:hypothetical protein C8J56DRAFT_976728 [Mycena floridula]|nr:hypothetical protein C8J56DRAFT_976728 [Mycena floridula]
MNTISLLTLSSSPAFLASLGLQGCCEPRAPGTGERPFSGCSNCVSFSELLSLGVCWASQRFSVSGIGSGLPDKYT